MNREEEKKQEGYKRFFRSTRRAIANLLIGDPETRASLMEKDFAMCGRMSSPASIASGGRTNVAFLQTCVVLQTLQGVVTIALTQGWVCLSPQA
jgi:Na+/glutamate symporter